MKKEDKTVHNNKLQIAKKTSWKRKKRYKEIKSGSVQICKDYSHLYRNVMKCSGSLPAFGGTYCYYL
jgi:hypothetical protein